MTTVRLAKKHEIDDHANATTNIHGIDDTEDLATKQFVEDSIADAAPASAEALEQHSADTTNVHGIADTALLETIAGAQAKADEAEATAIATAAADATFKANTAQSTALAYIDAQIGLRPLKDPARVAVLSDVNVSSPGATLDTVTMSPGDRVLLFGQTDGAQNGPYVYNGPSATMTRTEDANSSAEMKPGLLIAITEGTYADKLFELKTDAPLTLGSTSLLFDLAAGGASGTPLIAYSGTSYAPRNTVTSSTTTPVTWVGPEPPTIGGGYALSIDLWINTTEVS